MDKNKLYILTIYLLIIVGCIITIQYGFIGLLLLAIVLFFHLNLKNIKFIIKNLKS